MEEYISSVSKLKSFHNWYNLKSPYVKESDVIDSIKGIKVTKISFDLGNLVDTYVTDKLIGTSTYPALSKKLNKVLHEEGEQELNTWVERFKSQNNYFLVQQEHTISLPTVLGTLNVKLRPDIYTLSEVIDIKTSKQTLNVGYYENDLQGLLYCEALDLDIAVYEHFWVSHATNRVIYKGCVRQNRISKAKIIEVATQFIVFCQKNGLMNYLLPPAPIDINSIYPSGKYKDMLVRDIIEKNLPYLKWAIKNTSYSFSENLVNIVNNLKLK